MGVVLLTMMVYVGIEPVLALAATGTKPEWKPVTLLNDEMGWQGWSNVDCVTVWLPARNWNWTMEPAATLMLSGEKMSELFLEETSTTVTDVWAEARPRRAERASVENCILIFGGLKREVFEKRREK